MSPPPRPVKLDITLDLNGEEQGLRIGADETLLSVLRGPAALTGAKRGCNQGVCGACTVLIDGLAMRSCLALAVNCQGRRITTVEGLAPVDAVTPLQQALVEGGAVQCGFCTPGIVIALSGLFRRNAKPDAGEIREALSGNLCRCSGYVKIVEAALRVAAGEGA